MELPVTLAKMLSPLIDQQFVQADVIVKKSSAGEGNPA